MLLLVFTQTTFANEDSEKEVRKVATTFVKAADKQDADLLLTTLYGDAIQFVILGPNVMKSSAEEYAAQIRAKKLGGKERTIIFDNVIMTGNNAAVVKLTATGGGLVFSYHLNMFKIEGEWKIMAITTAVTR